MKRNRRAGIEDVPLRDVRFDDLQVGAVLKFAVKAKHLAVNPADGIELPRLPEAEQRYLTHEQLHRVAVASVRLRTWCSCSAIAACASVKRWHCG
jgi:hypothetical protein